jgi:hypothetical protein
LPENVDRSALPLHRTMEVMLEHIDISDFAAVSGKISTLHLPDGSTLSVKIDNLTSKPQSRNPYAPDTQRIPFSVNMTAQQATDFIGGPCAIDIDPSVRIEGVYVSRVAPLGRDPAGAYFEVVFN